MSGYGGPEQGGTQNDGSGGTRALGGRVGATIMALVPFVAVALFLVFGFALGAWAWAWLWFLLIPVAGIIIYGPGSSGRR
jgi:hypothetical protein